MARTPGALGQKTMITFINKILPEFKVDGKFSRTLKVKF